MKRRVRTGLVSLMPIRSSIRLSARIGFSAVLALSTLALSARANNIIVNGNFSSTTDIGSYSGTSGQLGYNINATGWTILNSGYDFVFNSAANAETGTTGVDGSLSLWGPDSPDGGSQNDFSDIPGGGNFVGADGAYEVGAITQTVNGLVVGDTYTLGFWWAAAQQAGYTGGTSSEWTVTLGTQSHSTVAENIPSEGFSGWMYQTFSFTATSASETLSFLATGTPGSTEPPFALLGGVTLGVPEPGSWMLVIAGLMVVLGAPGAKRWLKSRSRA